MRVVLAVARTVTATVRLLDVLEIFRSDFRVRVLFVVDFGSQYSDGVAELLRATGARVIAYQDLKSLDIDLVITTNSKANVGAGNAPVVVIPHGVGYHKYLHDGPTGEPRLSGVVSADAARDRRIIQVLTDESQRPLLAAHRPEVAARARVVRDPFIDRLKASTHLREDYRRSLGVDERQLVVMTSTWGEQSLFRRWQRLPAQLLRELPADEYAVAAILHPNVWFGDGPWQVRTWLADARDAGLILVPPTQGWQATLVSANAVIGDHGSVTFYAAALGLPLLLGTFGDEVVPETPMADLGSLAPRLDWNTPLAGQIRRLTSSQNPAAYQTVTGRAFGDGGPKSDSLQTLLYRVLDLPEPDGEPEVWAWAKPVIDQTAVTSFAIYTRTAADGRLEISRFPAAVDDASSNPMGPRTGHVRHLATYEDELNIGRRQSASTMTYRDLLTEAEAQAWVLRHQGEHQIVAAPSTSGVWISVRDGGLLFCSATHAVDPMLLTAVVYHLLLRGELPKDVEIPLRSMVLVGRRQIRTLTTLAVWPPEAPEALRRGPNRTFD